jgi:hypothetical protein
MRMSQLRSPKVRKIIGLRGQAARLRSRYQAALEQTAVLQHRASRLDQEARALKGTLTDCELRELRRAWSGV